MNTVSDEMQAFAGIVDNEEIIAKPLDYIPVVTGDPLANDGNPWEISVAIRDNFEGLKKMGQGDLYKIVLFGSGEGQNNLFRGIREDETEFRQDVFNWAFLTATNMSNTLNGKYTNTIEEFEVMKKSTIGLVKESIEEMRANDFNPTKYIKTDAFESTVDTH